MGVVHVAISGSIPEVIRVALLRQCVRMSVWDPIESLGLAYEFVFITMNMVLQSKNNRSLLHLPIHQPVCRDTLILLISVSPISGTFDPTFLLSNLLFNLTHLTSWLYLSVGWTVASPLFLSTYLVTFFTNLITLLLMVLVSMLRNLYF